MSRLIDTLAADAPKALTAINTARAKARAGAWKLVGKDAPDHDIDGDRPLIIDLDATLITAHSEKELAASTFSGVSGSTHSARGSTTGPAAPGSRCRCCCAPGRRVQHRRRPYPGCAGRARAAPVRTRSDRGRPEPVDPHRRRRRDP